MDNPERIEGIERILRTELNRTRRRYKAAAEKFRGVIQDIPSGTPHADGVTGIINATARHNLALDAYRAALKRFHDYAIQRMIPDDLKPKARKSPTQ